MKFKHFVSREFRVLATFVGTIIGAGIFGVPFVMSRAGVGVTLVHFLILGLVLFMASLFYSRMVRAIPGRHRFPGYAGVLLGGWGKDLAGALGLLAGWAALIIYIILGGIFLFELLGDFLGGTLFLYQCVFALSSVFVVCGGLRAVGRSEGFMATALVIVALVIIGLAIPHAATENFVMFGPGRFWLPYGVVLFSLSGLTVIPELRDLLGRNEALHHFPRVLGWGMFVATLITVLFGLAVVGVTGSATTPDAVSGLVGPLGRGVVFLGAFFGLLAIITSFFTFLMNQEETLEFDFKINRVLSWVLAAGVPILFFAIGSRDFIRGLGIAGGVLGGLVDALLMVMYIAFLRKEKKSPLHYFIPILIGAAFIVGAFNELFGV